MTTKSDHSRRIWKLQAVKAFTNCEPLSLWDIRKSIGQQALDALFNEGFLSYPDDPVAGAELVKANLHDRYGKNFLNRNPTHR